MKKTYNQPECITVQLGTRTSILQASLPIGSEEVTDPNDSLTKEDRSGSRSLWDEEW